MLNAAGMFPRSHPPGLGGDVAWIISEVVVCAIVSEALAKCLKTDTHGNYRRCRTRRVRARCRGVVFALGRIRGDIQPGSCLYLTYSPRCFCTWTEYKYYKL